MGHVCTDSNCVCDWPREANYYVEVIIGRDIPGGTDTTYFYEWRCAEHVREYEVGERIESRDTGGETPGKVIEWTVLEVKSTHLRGAK